MSFTSEALHTCGRFFSGAGAVTTLQSQRGDEGRCLNLEYCATKLHQMQRLWDTGNQSERRAALRDVFEELGIDLVGIYLSPPLVDEKQPCT
ncbi:hypothetical protein ANRL4_01891 [Anaerolineae bacterium]|nr:hypothetical protein ANRL4_01891 [Anaerolineae bacterium]